MDSSNLPRPAVVLLVGGLGTRLRERLGDQTPKPLAPIGGHPFLWYLLRYVLEQGFDRVILATSHLSQAFCAELQRYAPAGMEVKFSVEDSPRGTGGALIEALPLIDTDPFVVLNGDSFVRAPILEMVEQHCRCEAVGTIALVPVHDCGRFGTVDVTGDDAISAFREKTGLSRPGWINAGVYVLSKRALDPILSADVSSIEREVFPRWIGNGLQGFRVDSPFIDIGVPDSYDSAEAFFRACEYV
jgi:NDP-sugar pyrophosphorylase family protein